MICEKWLNCAVLPHEHRNDLFVSDNEEIRDIGMFIKDDSIIQTLSGKSYGHKSEKASIYAHFYSLKQVSKLFISRDIDDFASGDFSYLGPFIYLISGHKITLLPKLENTLVYLSIHKQSKNSIYQLWNCYDKGSVATATPPLVHNVNIKCYVGHFNQCFAYKVL